jgi:hypothetical protein
MSKLSRPSIVVAACTLAALSLAAAARQIEFSALSPQGFADIGHNAVDRERALKTLGDFCQTLAAGLPEGQTLRLELQDIDLAGELRMLRSGEVRVLRGRADWPRMTLRYTLVDGSQTLKSGRAELQDMDYLLRPISETGRYGELGYEKRMLQHWFEQNMAVR